METIVYPKEIELHTIKRGEPKRLLIPKSQQQSPGSIEEAETLHKNELQELSEKVK